MNNDTNSQTIDIPLPDDTNPSFGSSGESSVTNNQTVSSIGANSHQNVNNSANVEKQEKQHGQIGQIGQQKSTTANTYANHSNTYANPYANNVTPNPYQYYGYYPTYPQMPQMLAQNYPYFMPQMIQPMVSIVPQMTSLTAQKTSITAINNHLINMKRETKRAEDYYDDEEDDDEDSDSDPTVARTASKASNVLPVHCTETMGLNPLIYQNIQSSPYFKNNLFQLKTYHEVIDEIFYSVKHLEPWEKGSRKVGGQTGMCGSVRGVGAGGIISTPFCILYKLFTLKLTRKQVNGLIRHKDSAFIRALGFMYIRFTQPPQHLYNWFEPFMEDEEQLDPKAGGGAPMTIGHMCRHMLTKLDWFSTLFPRVPVPIQKQIEQQLKQRDAHYEQQIKEERGIEEGELDEQQQQPEEEEEEPEKEETPSSRSGGSSRDRNLKHRSERERRHSRDRRRSRERERSRDKGRRYDDRHRHRSRSHSPHSSRQRDNRSEKSDRNEHRHRRR